ncbi:hypothetical protein DNC80_14350 [Flavobacterium sp. SOK18b]|uniref:type 2 lanthipeptide synthetase LanM n=1 Tax=Flavobacterium sp. SOK18b TaxID=797900 RepID=UPI0015FDE39C|nr:type 2 lanthipeptide synthetase LanM [Flavobacterium sp. SOK18b]MBB1194848.1 hypothetical protein [Flavobacterium sp. SOK18b]
MAKVFEYIYTKSLLPFECITMLKSSKQISNKINSQYLDSLKKVVDKNASNEQFNKYCERLNLNEESFALMFSKETINTEKNELPSWLEILYEFSVFENVNKINKKDSELPFYDILFPLVDFSICTVEKKINKKISGNIVDKLLQFFYKDLVSNSHYVFFDEFSLYLKENNYIAIESESDNKYYKKFSKKTLSDKYLNIFTKYPMLARTIATKTHQNILFITKLFERLEKDTNDLEKKFQIKIGNLNDILLNAGDKHNGETTVILIFDNDLKIVYKPTNLEITDAYNDLLEWIDDALEINLKKFKTLNKGDYGWMEFIESNECETISDIKEYYEKAGVIMGLAYFLSTRDYHFENVIASGNCPVLIDHETIIGPRLKHTINNDVKKYANSILESLLLPTINETREIEICGFGSLVQKKHHTFISAKLINSNKDSIKRVPQLITQSYDLKHIPHLNSIPHYIENYKMEFMVGFNKLYHLVLDKKMFLLSKTSPINNFKDKKIRFLMRNTDVYAKILNILSKTEYLADSISYGIKQELLARAYILSEDLNISLLGSERDQITQGNIPAFYTNTLSNDLILENGKRIDLFEMNAMDNLKYKIRHASIENLNEQLELIEESLSLHALTT